MIKINKFGVFTPEQSDAARTVNDLCEKLDNQNYFTVQDINKIRKEIKAVHDICREAFGKPMFAWQVDHFQLQMYLENEYHFIFVLDQTLTWTLNRWTKAIAHELAIYFYKSQSMVLYNFQVRLMCYWLMFQYFKMEVFKGHHCKEVIDLTFKTLEDLGSAVLEGKEEIKRWRADNDTLIKKLNSKKSQWRQEKARCERLVNGRMKSKEVELYHMLAVSSPKHSFEINIKVMATKLGLSLKEVERKS